MAIQPATLRDLSYIVSLSKRHAEEVGFLTRDAMAGYLERNKVTMATENGEPAGYFLHGALYERIRIFQACVQLDARGLNHGRDLLGALIIRGANAGTRSVTLHCRDGLAANGFWSACGFKLANLQLGGSARRKVINEWELVISDALSDPALPYAARFLAAIRARTQEGTRETPCSGRT